MKECKECGLPQCCDYAYEGCVYCLETDNKALKARIAELMDAAREFLEIGDDLRGFDGDKRGMLDALYEARDRLRAALPEGENGK